MNVSELMKSLLKNKLNTGNRLKSTINDCQIKTCFIAMMIVLISGLFFACAASMHPAADNNTKISIEELYGYYEFNENVFMNPLSSFFPFKGHMPFYGISENALSIISIQDGSVQRIPGSFEIKPLDREQFKEMFAMDFSIPSIDGYKNCFEYAVFTSEGTPEYRLYIMDQEIWLVQVHTKNFIWSIYDLSQTDKVKTGPDGNLIVPTEAPYVYQEGFQFEISSGKTVLDPVFAGDEKSMEILQDTIEFYDTQAVRTENVDIFEAGDYIRFYDATGKDDTLYYVFMNQAIADQPQMQTNKNTISRVPIPMERYESLYMLWESLMTLPDKVTVLSGDESISALVFRQHEKVDLAGLKEQLSWLKIKSDDIYPFRVFLEGEELYGWYEIYDAETMEALNIIHPSGLKPQTYLFQNVKPGHSYIITLCSGYSTLADSYGLKIIFGVKLS